MLQEGKDITGERLEDERSSKKNGLFSNTHEEPVAVCRAERSAINKKRLRRRQKEAGRGTDCFQKLVRRAMWKEA